MSQKSMIDFPNALGGDGPMTAAAPRPEMLRCQRWRRGQASYRPAGEVIDPSRYGAEPIEEAAAKRFVVENHYSGSYPAARLRVGLFEARRFERPQLVGVAVFSVPMNNRAGPRYTGLEARQVVELGRFCLLDEVGANGETWFLARAGRILRQALPDVRAALAYSDPVARTSACGRRQVMPGHVGTIYQASNSRYLGRSSGRRLILAPDGQVISERALSKLRNEERGAAYAYRQLLLAGAPPRERYESGRDYVARALEEGPFRRVRHPGNHIYAFAIGSRRERALGEAGFVPALAYPKEIDRTPGAQAGLAA